MVTWQWLLVLVLIVVSAAALLGSSWPRALVSEGFQDPAPTVHHAHHETIRGFCREYLAYSGDHVVPRPDHPAVPAAPATAPAATAPAAPAPPAPPALDAQLASFAQAALAQVKQGAAAPPAQ